MPVIATASITACSVSFSRAPRLAVAVAEGRDDADRVRLGSHHLAGRRPRLPRNVKIQHEVGNEKEDVFDKNNIALPTIDPITETYRPGSRALNYRSEPFLNRLSLKPNEKSHAYSSSMFGDPATIIPQGYLGDATKFRVVHGGAEVFHIYHLHGGGDRWRMEPRSRPRQLVRQHGVARRHRSRALNPTASTPSTPGRARVSTWRSRGEWVACSRLPATSCSTATSPSTTRRACGESGECSTPCSRIWLRCPTLAVSGYVPPEAVTSAELIGKTMPNGTVITAANLATGSPRRSHRRALQSTTRTQRCGTGPSTTAILLRRCTSASPSRRPWRLQTSPRAYQVTSALNRSTDLSAIDR